MFRIPIILIKKPVISPTYIIIFLSHTKIMSYYNYHAIAHKLLENKNCIAVSVFSKYHHISPALVLYFDNHKPIPIRDYMWHTYLPIIKELNLIINNPENIPLN